MARGFGGVRRPARRGRRRQAASANSPGPGWSWGYIANVFVLAAHRNGGVGGALLAAAVDHARTAGFVRLVLSPSERSIPFYARAGFRPATSLLLLPLE